MIRRLVHTVAVDTGALRESPAFRRLWTGQMVSLVGRQITTVAVPYQVYSLTGSPLAVGAVGRAPGIPLGGVSLGAGPIIDRFDRRRILILTQLGLSVCSGLLAIGALLGHPPLFAIYLIVAAAAGGGGAELTATRTA